MFDQEHYDILLTGVPRWTAYLLRQGTGFRAQLEDADLRGANLKYATLEGADLRYALLNATTLSSAFLNDADLQCADLTDANLVGTVLIDSNLTLTSFARANLQRACMHGANLTDATLVCADLSEADLEDAMVSGTRVDTVTRGPLFDADGPQFTDLSNVKGLTQVQLNAMKGDSGTVLPDSLARPAHWPSLPGLLNGQQLNANSSSTRKHTERTDRFASLRSLVEDPQFLNALVAKPAEPVPAPNPDRFVFLSYKREDRPRVQTLRDALIRNGISVWWDDDIPYDQNWDDEIDTHLEAAEIVLTVWTDKSIASREVKNEALYAIRNNKLVQVQMGNPKLGPRYEAIQCADLTAWSPAQDHPDFDRLIGTLRRRLEG